MRPSTVVAVLLCAGLWVSSAAAQQEVSSMFGAHAGELALPPLAALGAAPLAAADGPQMVRAAATPSAKSPRRAFLLSALLPGSGQMYAGSWLRGAIFLGLEATAAGLWYTWKSDGEDLEDEFRAMADAHWDPDAYLNWRETSRAIRYNSFTHALPCSTEVRAGTLSACGGSEKQQYYELLGKYDQFVAGWDDLAFVGSGNRVTNLADFDSVETVQSELRLDYEVRRDESNDQLKRATNVAGLILVNHVLSAIDAARTARARARGVDQALIDRRTRFLVGLHSGTQGSVPMVYAYKPFD